MNLMYINGHQKYMRPIVANTNILMIFPQEGMIALKFVVLFFFCPYLPSLNSFFTFKRVTSENFLRNGSNGPELN